MADRIQDTLTRAIDAAVNRLNNIGVTVRLSPAVMAAVAILAGVLFAIVLALLFPTRTWLVLILGLAAIVIVYLILAAMNRS